MFKWKDYEENSCLFIEGIDLNVAVLRHKDFQLTDVATSYKFKLKLSNLEEAKMYSEKILQDYWKRVYKDLGKQLEKLK